MHGVIEESNTSWSSPASQVTEDTKNRLFLDARKVKEGTNKTLISFLTEILCRLQNKRDISGIDLKGVFFQILLEHLFRWLVSVFLRYFTHMYVNVFVGEDCFAMLFRHWNPLSQIKKRKQYFQRAPTGFKIILGQPIHYSIYCICNSYPFFIHK